MNTYLGAAQNLSPADVDDDTVAASAITYLEGYLWDPSDAKDAFVKAATVGARGQADGGVDAVGRVLRRSLPRRVPAAHPLTNRRLAVRQRGGTAQPLSDRAISKRRSRRCARMRSSRSSPAARRDASSSRRTETEAVPASPIDAAWSTRPARAICSRPGFLFGLARGTDMATAARLGAPGGRRGHPAPRRAAGSVAQGACGQERSAGVGGRRRGGLSVTNG